MCNEGVRVKTPMCPFPNQAERPVGPPPPIRNILYQPAWPALLLEYISTVQPDEDQCSKHQLSADQQLSTSTVVDLKTIFQLFCSIDQ